MASSQSPRWYKRGKGRIDICHYTTKSMHGWSRNSPEPLISYSFSKSSSSRIMQQIQLRTKLRAWLQGCRATGPITLSTLAGGWCSGKYLGGRGHDPDKWNGIIWETQSWKHWTYKLLMHVQTNSSSLPKKSSLSLQNNALVGYFSQDLFLPPLIASMSLYLRLGPSTAEREKSETAYTPLSYRTSPICLGRNQGSIGEFPRALDQGGQHVRLDLV